MKILITGSTGFLGSHTAEYFSKQGHQVTGLDIQPGIYTQLTQDVRAGLPDQQYDLVIHYAAEVRGRANIENNYLKMIANVELDRQVFEWATTHAQRIIYPSSCAVYPVEYQVKTNTPLHEGMIDFDTGTIGVSDHLYGWSKLTAERMLWQIAKETDVQISIMRPFSGYGPGQTTDYPMANLVELIKQTPDRARVWGTGSQTRDFVHVSDIVKTVNWLSQDSVKYRTVNIGTGRAISFLDLIKILHQEIHNRPPGVVEALVGKPVGMMHRVADTQLQKTLGIVPTISLEDGIRTLL